MRTHTRLTTPPGQAPEAEAESSRQDETYVRGLQLPSEPRVPGRFRRPLLVAGTLLLAVLAGYAAFLVATSGQTFDPALDPSRLDSPTEQDSPAPQLPDGGEGA